MAKPNHDIEKYLRGELTPQEMHALEKKALDDPFLADALEGGSMLHAEDFTRDVKNLQEAISNKKKNSRWIWPMRIAASLLVLFIVLFAVREILETTPTEQTIAFTEETNETFAKPEPAEELMSDASDSSSEAKPTPHAAQAQSTSKDQGIPKEKKSIAQQIVKDEPSTLLAEADDMEEEIAEIPPIAAISEEAKKPVAPIAPIELNPAPAAVEAKEADRERAALAKKIDISRTAGMTSTLTPAIIRGIVKSAEDGTPIPGVNVVIKGTTTGTSTNEFGEYEIKPPTSQATIVFAFIGFQSQEHTVDATTTALDVTLELDAVALSEVVVTGTGYSSDKAVVSYEAAQPEEGNRSFRNYLESNLRYPQQAIDSKIEGRVAVDFTVHTNGTVSDFKIIRGIGYGCDEELIRLIKEGPKWIPAKRDGVATPERVRVRFKFTLSR